MANTPLRDVNPQFASERNRRGENLQPMSRTDVIFELLRRSFSRRGKMSLKIVREAERVLTTASTAVTAERVFLPE
jgi:hypothetical protein